MYPMPSAAKAAELYGAASAAANPVAELVAVHDAMIGRLRDVKLAIADGRIEDRLATITKIARVIEMLRMALDRERGGDVAANLDGLYTYFARRLTSVNFTNDAAICDELISRLAELRSGWAALLDPANGGSDAPLEAASLSA